jgi:hypothetical protein
VVSQCANPNCQRKFRYLRDGKVYLFARSATTGRKRLEHFWLCGECSERMYLICVNQSEVKTVCRPMELSPQARPYPDWGQIAGKVG